MWRKPIQALSRTQLLITESAAYQLFSFCRLLFSSKCDRIHSRCMWTDRFSALLHYAQNTFPELFQFLLHRCDVSRIARWYHNQLSVAAILHRLDAVLWTWIGRRSYHELSRGLPHCRWFVCLLAIWIKDVKILTIKTKIMSIEPTKIIAIKLLIQVFF